jgi:hypothetical protein
MIERTYLLFEILAILLGLWALHGTQKKPTIITLVYVCIELVVLSSIDCGWLPKMFIYIIYFGLILLCIFEFDDKVYEACIYFSLDIALVSAVQLICGLFLCLIFQTLNISEIMMLFLNVLSCGIILVIYCKWNLHKYVRAVLKNRILSKVILAALGLGCIGVFGMAKQDMRIYWKDAVTIAVFTIMIFAVVFQWQKEKWENRQKEEELKAFSQYNLIYKDLIRDVRKRQHDFNNHLQAIFSMNMMADSLEELVKEQNEYCAEMIHNNMTNKLLREDISSVFAGFLYTKITKAEEANIKVKYSIHLEDIEKYISFSDLVEMLGNLFDNAIEALEDEQEGKIIDFSIYQSKEMLEIEIANPYNWERGDNLSELLQEGKSTKGSGRGWGIANVTKVVDKYHGVFEVKARQISGMEWIVFRIKIQIAERELSE